LAQGTILVVEDDKKTVATIKLYLENVGFVVAVAHDGGHALELARAALPDLIVLDLMLPRVAGFDLCRRAESEVPIINSTLDTGVAGPYTVIVMSNYDPPSAMNIAKQVRQRLGQTD
jgi:CheY-like chemotaxis protein